MDESAGDSSNAKPHSGIPEAEFMEDVDKYMLNPNVNGNADLVIRKLEDQHVKYKFMEYNLMSKKKRWQTQIPELERAIEMIGLLKKNGDSTENISTHFLLSSQLYLKADIKPTDKVCLWLGANVMLEYELDEALELLNKNVVASKKSLGLLEKDLDFLRDQATTTEVNMARVHNWRVKRKQMEEQTNSSS